MSADGDRRHPLFALDDADLDLVLRMVLASGSLKDLAQAYGVSYPTIRARLDRLIARLGALVADKPPDPLTDLLADLVEQNELTARGARQIQKLAREQRARAQGVQA
jgi:hypothetical protein